MNADSLIDVLLMLIEGLLVMLGICIIGIVCVHSDVMSFLCFQHTGASGSVSALSTSCSLSSFFSKWVGNQACSLTPTPTHTHTHKLIGNVMSNNNANAVIGKEKSFSFFCCCRRCRTDGCLWSTSTRSWVFPCPREITEETVLSMIPETPLTLSTTSG